MLCIFLFNDPVEMIPSPRPIAPQQLSTVQSNIFEYTFNEGKSLLKIAKFAICRFCAIVPSNSQVTDYINEVLAIHNMTRISDQPRIADASQIPWGPHIKFYPPLKIANEESLRLVPVYQYFTSMVRDTFAYVTGDWCERGFGGGTPHYGIDVAANYGSQILSPFAGTVVIQNSVAAGRVVGIIKDHMIIFFGHMDKRYIKNGSYVKKGEAVGTVGMTGITTGPHVHVGYGLETPNANGGSVFGSKYYKLTDPKLFFYREQYLATQQR
jgi:murein DD-endopeptidase MepM/ murein hydrolase activator NlpD